MQFTMTLSLHLVMKGQSLDSLLIALNPAAGSVQWETAIDAGHITQHYPVVDDDLWVPADGFFEYTSVTKVTSGGNHVDTYEVPVAFETMPAVGDDRIYVTYTDETLRAYEAIDIQSPKQLRKTSAGLVRISLDQITIATHVSSK